MLVSELSSWFGTENVINIYPAKKRMISKQESFMVSRIKDRLYLEQHLYHLAAVIVHHPTTLMCNIILHKNIKQYRWNFIHNVCVVFWIIPRVRWWLIYIRLDFLLYFTFAITLRICYSDRRLNPLHHKFNIDFYIWFENIIIAPPLYALAPWYVTVAS